MGSRQIASDPTRGHGDDDGRQPLAESAEGRSSRRGGQSSSHGPWDEVAVRQLQLVRGAVSSKMVASRTALQSLQSVDMDDLSDGERTCVICYNDYGVESPEGINEAPLRLPKCKHVFGDHCIKKWFEDSDSCPYCRDKLPSEPRPSGNSARSFMNMMRMRGVPLPAGFSEQFYSRLMGGSVGDLEFFDAVARQRRLVERRPPPDDASGEDQRRTRQRRNNPSPTRTPPSASGGPQPDAQPALSASTVQNLFGGPQPRQDHWNPVSAQTQVERPAVTSSMPHQEAGQYGPPEGPRPLFSPSYGVPLLSTTGPARTRSRPSTHQPGQNLQGTGDTGNLIGSFSHGQLPNPLQGLSRTVMFEGLSSNIPSLRPAAAANPAQISLTHQTANAAPGSEQVQRGPLPSSFGPNRNRPW